MLRNRTIRSVARDLDRQWMSDDYFDLIVWYEADRAIHGFQLCYDVRGNERAITWTKARGFQHAVVDSGEDLPTENKSPILVGEAPFPAGEVLAQFRERGTCLEAEIRDLVTTRLEEFGRRTGPVQGNSG